MEQNQQKVRDIKGPAFSNFNPDQEYSPVACDFTDELEAASVRKYPLEIHYFTESGEEKSTQGMVVDIRIENRAEYVFLSNKESIRLDRIKLLHRV